MAGARKDRTWGFIDRRGQWVVQPQYLAVSHFRGGTAFVNHEGIEYMLRADGERVPYYDVVLGTPKPRENLPTR